MAVEATQVAEADVMEASVVQAAVVEEDAVSAAASAECTFEERDASLDVFGSESEGDWSGTMLPLPPLSPGRQETATALAPQRQSDEDTARQMARATAALLTASAYGPMCARAFVAPCDVGLGLFARTCLARGAQICEYSGPRLPVPLQLRGRYVLKVPSLPVIIDGRCENSPFSVPESCGVYANHSVGSRRARPPFPQPRPRRVHDASYRRSGTLRSNTLSRPTGCGWLRRSGLRRGRKFASTTRTAWRASPTGGGRLLPRRAGGNTGCRLRLRCRCQRSSAPAPWRASSRPRPSRCPTRRSSLPRRLSRGQEAPRVGTRGYGCWSL